MRVDLLIHSIGQLLTLASPPGSKVGPDMGDLGLIADGAVAIREGCIALVGNSPVVEDLVEAKEALDADGKVVMPGFVDPHTHLLFAGSRVDEFEMRLQGKSYLEIMAAGGGIMSTVRAAREASVKELVAQSLPRLDRMLAHGTTTAEVKTGYGLDYGPEMRMLDAIKILDRQHPIDLVPTFMGAHAIPEEYEGQSDEYVQLVVEGMLPRAAKEGALFCDVFCEEGAFTLEQSRRILERAKELGLGLKIHADEFKNLGGATLAAQLGAISAEHLVHTREEEMRFLARAGTIAVLLPGTPFGLAQPQYAPARRLIDLGVPVALATDLNPGTCYCESMAFITALACRYMGMTPAEAVVASTINAAYAIGQGKEVGSLEEGKKADLIVLDTHDYRDLAYRFGTNLVTMVFKAGQRVWPL